MYPTKASMPDPTSPQMDFSPNNLPPNYQQAVHPPEVQTSQPMPVTQQIMVQAPAVGGQACRITCPSCHGEIVTKVEYEPSTRTHLIALLLCLGGCCCCAPIPYCTDSCKTANHNCPKCGSFIGSFKQ